MIPDSIKKEHVLKALEEAESQGIPKGRQSHRNYVEYNAKRYPPKYIISLANKYAGGKLLGTSEVRRIECRLFLKSLGFNVLESSKIQPSNVSRLRNEDTSDIISDFKKWFHSEPGQKNLITIENEKKEVTDLMNRLDTMDKDSVEFIDSVLYGLLPYSKTKYAKRVSTFPVFLNVKLLFRNYNYNDSDWNKIANMIYRLDVRNSLTKDMKNKSTISKVNNNHNSVIAYYKPS